MSYLQLTVTELQLYLTKVSSSVSKLCEDRQVHITSITLNWGA